MRRFLAAQFALPGRGQNSDNEMYAGPVSWYLLFLTAERLVSVLRESA